MRALLPIVCMCLLALWACDDESTAEADAALGGEAGASGEAGEAGEAGASGEAGEAGAGNIGGGGEAGGGGVAGEAGGGGVAGEAGGGGVAGEAGGGGEAGGVAGSGGEAGGGGIGGEAGGSVEEPEWECKPDAPCADGFVCWYIFEGFPELGVCVEGCDPVNRAGCDEGETCYLADEEGGTLCFDTGDRGLGEDCADLSLCVDGADCFQVEPDRWECRAFCDLRNPCPDGGACLPSGRGHWGACLTP